MDHKYLYPSASEDDDLDQDQDQDQGVDDEAVLPKSVQAALKFTHSIREPLNERAKRFVWIQTRLLESTFRPTPRFNAKESKVAAPVVNVVRFVRGLWSAIDPIRALLRVASVVNAYYMMTRRDWFADNQLGQRGRHETLCDYDYCAFVYLHQLLETGYISYREPISVVHELLRPVCYLHDDHSVGVRQLVRSGVPNQLYTIQTELVPYTDAVRAHNALYHILRDKPSFASLWNRVMPYEPSHSTLWNFDPLPRCHSVAQRRGPQHRFHRRPSI